MSFINDGINDDDKEIVELARTQTAQQMPVYKADHFVGKAQLTPYGAMKQYLLEIESRDHSIMENDYNIEKMQIDIDDLTEQLDFADDKFSKRRIENEIKHKERKKAQFVKIDQRAKAERKMYIDMIKELDQSELGKTHDGKRILDLINDPENNEDLEREYWILRMGKQAAMDMIAYGRVGVGNMDSLTMMNADDQRQALSLATDVFVWHENRMQHILTDANEKYAQLDHTELTKSLMLTKD